jgi:hypothetical protein
MSYDYSGHEEKPAHELVERLHRQVRDLIAAQEAEAAAELALQKAKDARRDLEERVIPESMAELGVKMLKTPDGFTVEVVADVRASIPKDRIAEAMAWLRANRCAALIKREVKAVFGMGEDRRAEEAVAELYKFTDSVADKAHVHPSTLKKFVKDKLRSGEAIPMDLFGAEEYSKVKLK